MKRQGKSKKNNVDYKRLALFILVLDAIIVGVVLIVKAITKDKETISLDGSSSGIVEKAEMINKLEAEYDGNSYNVPESYTTKDEIYKGQDNVELTEEQLNQLKIDVNNKFATYTAQEVGIDVNMENVKLIFNTGTTRIADRQCVVFNVYEQNGDKISYIAKCAMSLDLEVLYTFDSELFVYRMVGQ